MKDTSISYLHGFGNHFQSEALPNSLPRGQNSPQRLAFGLYAEQLSGSAFTMPRAQNLTSWCYRIRPSVVQSEFTALNMDSALVTQIPAMPPTQLRWGPMPYPKTACDFIQGLMPLLSNGSPESLSGAAIYLYAITASMRDYFYDADGELVFVLQEGRLQFKTEFGLIEAMPGEITVIPRGIKFQVKLLDTQARGYICENFGQPFRLPDLGVIGANGLANPRDFQIPCAAFEELDGDFNLICKFQNHLWTAKINHSPLDVVAWHGNYFPYKYDLRLFNTINTVSFDHPDPSIFTVLTSPSAIPGMANLDFVIFPPRWMVAENTFRPPYFHRNIMNEYMGLIYGAYDAKETGFVPGGGSLHNCMSAHGPDAQAYEKAVNASLTPEYYSGTMAFMFESNQVWKASPEALTATFRQKDYVDCWQGLKANFRPDFAY